MSPITLRQLFSQGPFVRFWGARIAGTTANQMLMVAVAWQMYDLTGSAWDLGLVGLFQFVPALLLTLPAGHVVDRIRRSTVFSLTILLQVLVALLLVFGPVGSVLLGGFGTLAIAGLWMRLFPALARRDRLIEN